MKTTLEIPDFLFRRANSVAAERGIPLRQFVTEAVQDKTENDLPGKAMDEAPRQAQPPPPGKERRSRRGRRSLWKDRSGSVAMIEMAR